MNIFEVFIKNSRGVSSVLGEILIAGIVVAALGSLFVVVNSAEKPVDHSHLSVEEQIDASSNLISLRHVGGEPVAIKDMKVNVQINGTNYVYSSSNVSKDLGGKNTFELADVITINTTQTWGVNLSDESNIDVKVVDAGAKEVLPLYIVDNNPESPSGGSVDSVSADFDAVPSSGVVPLSVNFTDRSTGSPTSWQWNFGDGSSNSTLQHPNHVFTNTGIFNVTLKVAKSGYNSTKTKVISATAPIVANFSAIPSGGVAPLSVNFTDLSTGSPTSWQWNFGDGSFNNTLQHPNHVFNNPGIYNVTLTAMKDGSSSSITRDLTVNNFNITGDTVVPKDNFTCNFTVLGAAHQYQYNGHTYNRMVTSRLKVGNKTFDPWGNYLLPVTSNLNGRNTSSWSLPTAYPAGTSVTVIGRAWILKDDHWWSSSYYYNLDSSWKNTMEVSSTSYSPNLKVLRNGDSVPQISGAMGQDSIEDYLEDYVDENNKIVLEENEAIFLFELGTTDLSSSAADFQDLVVLMTVDPAQAS